MLSTHAPSRCLTAFYLIHPEQQFGHQHASVFCKNAGAAQVNPHVNGSKFVLGIYLKGGVTYKIDEDVFIIVSHPD